MCQYKSVNPRKVSCSKRKIHPMQLSCTLRVKTEVKGTATSNSRVDNMCHCWMSEPSLTWDSKIKCSFVTV